MKNDTIFVRLRSSYHLGDSKMLKKGTLRRRIYLFLLIGIDENGFRKMKEEGQIYKTCLIIFIFPGD